MNGSFYDSAFSTSEKNRIPSTATEYGVQDKVFALSLEEAKKYFSSDSERQSKSTKYLISKDSWFSNPPAWWLRSQGYGFSGTVTAAVDGDGLIFDGGYSPNANDVGVRPAIWVNIS